jgi:hypothetical protein
MRSISVHRLLVICVTLSLIAFPVPAKGKRSVRGCSVIADDIGGTPLAGNIGQPIDNALLMDGAELSRLLMVFPAIFYMREDDQPNASAYWMILPDLLRQEGRDSRCCPDGTVLIGLKLIEYERRATYGTGLSIPAIEAHEFDHIAQYKYKFPWEEGKWRELHADFFAGWYIAHRNRFLVTSPDQAMANFYYKGDYDFNNPDHHGTPEERVAAFRAGFEFNRRSNVPSGFLAYQAGIDYLRMCGCSQ